MGRAGMPVGAGGGGEGGVNWTRAGRGPSLSLSHTNDSCIHIYIYPRSSRSLSHELAGHGPLLARPWLTPFRTQPAVHGVLGKIEQHATHGQLQKDLRPSAVGELHQPGPRAALA